jgi:hypothetical protein
VACDGESVSGVIESTGNWHTYRTSTLTGLLHLPAGRHVVRIVPKSMPHGAVMNLRTVSLAPEAQ